MRIRDESGAVMPLATAGIAVVILFLALTLEVGRALNERERLKGATEAAALAGALQAQPVLQLAVPQSRYVCSREASGLVDCEWDYQTVPLYGLETDVATNWQEMAGCNAGDWRCPAAPTVVCRAVIYPAGTDQVMGYAFSRNIATAPDVTSTVNLIQVDDKSGTTQVSAWGQLQTHLGRLFGRSSLEYPTGSVGEAVLRPLPWPDPGKRC